MTDAIVVRSRQNSTPAVPAQVLGAGGGGLPEKLQLASALAAAGPKNLPESYVRNVGACLMAMDYAERMDLSLFEVLGEVSFNRGRATVGARLQKKLAARQGYRTRKVAGDETFCTVAVLGPDGAEIGSATYTIEMADALGLVKRNDLYKKDPGQMLFHRATTRALDHYGPGEYANVFVDAYTEPDVIDTLTAAQPAQDEATEVVDVDEAPASEEPADVQEEPEASDSAPLRDLCAGHDNKAITELKAVKAVRAQFPDKELANAKAVDDDPEAKAWAIDWIDRGGSTE